jgi:hypothetical protein
MLHIGRGSRAPLRLTLRQMSTEPDGAPSPGSDRYPVDSDRIGGDGAGDQLGSEGTRSHADNPSSLPDGPESDYISAMARARQRKERDEQRRAPGTWLPGSDDFDRDPEPGEDTEFGVDGPIREYTSRQLGLRLRPKQFERLLEAARLYGVRPTTMARMMVVRGINAIYDAELRSRARELRDEP